MKKIYALIMLLAAVSVSADAASKWKLYLNPGHGGYNSNDRQIVMPAVNGVKFTETQGCFWESEGNTYRAWAVEYFWKKRVNNNIKLSRYTNTSAGDLALSTIASQANSYGGYFLSLHTNGGNASANYHVSICRGISSSNYGAYNSMSLTMAKDAAYWQGGESTASMSSKKRGGGKSNHLTNKTYSTDRGNTDRNFYNGSSLGVLRTNNAVGYLVESWFHDYRPEAFRLLSVGYNYFLAWQLMRAYLDSPGLEGVNLYPIIFGDIRDLSKSCGYTSYATRGRDKYLALNGCKVTLKNVVSGGTKTYTTDKFNNGFFTFYDCMPGETYEITVEKAGYKTQTKRVTVGDAQGTQHKVTFDMVEGTNDGITVDPGVADFGIITLGSSKSVSFTVEGEGLSGNITASSNNSLFALSSTSVAVGGKLTVTYTPTAVGSHSATITLKNGSFSKTILVHGSGRNAPIYFGPGWYACETELDWKENSDPSGASVKLTPKEWDYTQIRSMCYGNGKLFLVSPTMGLIYIINARTGEFVGYLPVSGMKGGTWAMCDIKNIGGKVYCSSLATTPAENTAAHNILRVYMWDKDDVDGNRTLILDTTLPSGYDRAGDTFDVVGDINDGMIYYVARSTSKNDDGYQINNILCYKMSNGTVNTTPTVIPIGDGSIALGSAPRIEAEANGEFWVDGANVYPMQLDVDGNIKSTVGSTGLASSENKAVPFGNAFKSFTFKGVTYGMATTYVAEGETVNGFTTTGNYQLGRAAMFDASDGWDNAVHLSYYPWKGMGTRVTEINGSLATGIEVVVNGDLGFEAWVLIHGQGIVYVKHGEVPSSVLEEQKTPVLTVDKTELELSTTVGSTATATINVSGADLTGDISLSITGENAGAFSLQKDMITVSEKTAEVSISYIPNEVGTHNAVLNITSDGAESKLVKLIGAAEADYSVLGTLTEGWNYSTEKSSVPEWITNDLTASTKAKMRSIAYASGKLYLLQSAEWCETPVVDILDAYTGENKGELNLTGVSGGIVPLSSLVAVDGVILGSNAAQTTEALKVYKWTSDNAAPQVIVNDEAHAEMAKGAKISFSGDMNNGRIWFTNDAENAVLYYEIKNGTVAQSPVVVNLLSGTAPFHTGCTSAYGSGSVYYNEDGSFWVDFKDDYPTLFSAPVESNGTLTAAKQVSVQTSLFAGNMSGTDFRLFSYNDSEYALAATYLGRDERVYAEDGITVESGEDNRLRYGAFTLVNVTEGVENATTTMGIYPASGLGDFLNEQYIANICVNTIQNGVDVWVCVNGQGVAYYYYGEDNATKVEGVDAENLEPAEYYNLQGIKVAKPSKGLYIKKQGKNATKVVL